MLMETFMKDSGRMTRLMDKVYIFIWMGQHIMENGWMTSKRGRERNHGQMVLCIEASSLMERNTVKEPLNGLTDLTFRENF
jgi:hypothetical protein